MKKKKNVSIIGIEKKNLSEEEKKKRKLSI